MKKTSYFLAAAAFSAAFSFVSCDPKENGGGGTDTPIGYTISAVVENGSSYNAMIDSVKVKEYVWNEETNEETNEILAATKYQNGGFTLTLPAIVPAKYLFALTEEAPESITFSDLNVKTYTVNGIYAYKEDVRLGDFEYFGINALQTEEYEAVYIYADRNCTFTGTDNHFEDGWSAIYNVVLQKGWNIMYIGGNEKAGATQVTTTKPAGLTFKWYFISDNYYNAPTKKSHSFLK